MTPLRIIIVDDEESIRASFKMLLEYAGHKVTTFDQPNFCIAENGGSCQRGESCFEVLMIDHLLDRCLGIDVVEKLKKRACPLSEARIILMSGDTTSIDLKKAETLGCVVVQKPIPFDLLKKLVKTD